MMMVRYERLERGARADQMGAAKATNPKSSWCANTQRRAKANSSVSWRSSARLSPCLAEKKTGDEQPVKIEFQAFDGEADEHF